MSIAAWVRVSVFYLLIIIGLKNKTKKFPVQLKTTGEHGSTNMKHR